MAEEAEVLSTGSESGAGVETQEQAAEQTTQVAGESQNSERQQVEPSSTETSSRGGQGRSNFNWANQRLLEKAIEKKLEAALQSHLTPLMEKLNSAQNPPATQSQSQEAPDYNDLSGWINKKIEQGLQQRLQAELPKTLNQFKGQLQGEFQKTTSMQEARNYLISQKDVGRDEAKLAEIRQVMTDNLLDYALDKEPLQATMRAIEIWRKSKTNPNTPSKAQLGTVTGGTGNQPKRELSVQELIAMQKKLAGSPTMDEQEKLHSQIDSLMVP